MLLDTTFILDLLRNNPEAVQKASSLKNSTEPLLTTTVTVFEIWQGSCDLKDSRKKQKIETLLSAIGLLPLDVEAAKKAGIIHNECYKNGTPIDPEESMIAGIAKTHNQSILTRNVKHFSKVDGLKIDTY